MTDEEKEEFFLKLIERFVIAVESIAAAVGDIADSLAVEEIEEN